MPAQRHGLGRYSRAPWIAKAGPTGRDRLAAPAPGLTCTSVCPRREPSTRTAIQRRINATDRRIDQLVYELYRLTDEEIAIVEEATR